MNSMTHIVLSGNIAFSVFLMTPGPRRLSLRLAICHIPPSNLCVSFLGLWPFRNGPHEKDIPKTSYMGLCYRKHI